MCFVCFIENKVCFVCFIEINGARSEVFMAVEGALTTNSSVFSSLQLHTAMIMAMGVLTFSVCLVQFLLAKLDGLFVCLFFVLLETTCVCFVYFTETSVCCCWF